MIDEEYNYEAKSVVEELIFILWLSVGIIAIVIPILALAL